MDADVIIVGAGPNGLMLACELGLAGLTPVVLETLPGPTEEPKANGLVGQVVTLVDRRGLYERITGVPGLPPAAPTFAFAAMQLELHRLGGDNPLRLLAVTQPKLVRILADRAAELGVSFRWGHTMTGLAQEADAVTVEVTGPDGPYRMSARYLVGADGGHSVTRKLAGIEFPGVSYDRATARWGHVSVPAEWREPGGGLDVPGYGIVPPFLGQRTEHGGLTYAPLPGNPPMIATTELDQPANDAPMTLAELRDSIGRVLGADIPIGPPDGDGPHLLRRRTGGSNRQAERFRDGRVFLLGDAAHVDAAGGQGLNQGMQDAANLGWKLAAVLRGGAPDRLLDTYDTERRLAARRVNMYAQALAALHAPGSDVTALRELFGELLGDRDTVRRLAALTAGTDLRYDMGDPDPHPLTGYSAPELDLDTDTGRLRLADLTRTARPLLLDLTGTGSWATELTAWSGQVDLITARPVESGVTGLLIRPDCYVAWASSQPPTPEAATGLRNAATRWFGTPVANAVPS